MTSSKILHQRSMEQGELLVKWEERTNKTRAKFRHMSREVSGKVFDVPDDNLVIFAYLKHYCQTLQVGQVCFNLAELNLPQPGTNFDSDYYSSIAFLFVHRDFQCRGIGSILMQEALRIMKSHDCNRPIRVQSAEEAVTFFERFGFVVKGIPINCFHSGSRMFKTINNMELVPV